MITISWAGALALVAVVAIIAFSGGAASTAKAHQREQQWLIRAQRIDHTALRILYNTLGYEFPDPDEEDQPAPSWPMRVKAWWGERMRPVVAEVEDEEDDEDTDCPECYVNGHMHRPWCPRAPLSDPDPGPPTDPHGFPTQPQHAVPTRIEDLALARALAEMEDRVRDWRSGKREEAAA